MNRMELDEFCAAAGVSNRKDDELCRRMKTALLITQEVQRMSRSDFRTKRSAAQTANSAGVKKEAF